MNQNRPDIPIQPVQQPILCSPYEKTKSTLDLRHRKPVKPSRNTNGATQATGTKPNPQAANNSNSLGKKNGLTSR